MSLLNWWNLVFILPAFAAVLYIVLMAAGVGLGDDFGLDADADVDGPDTSLVDFTGPDPDLAHAGGGIDLLSLFGIGKAFLSLLLISFGLIWGFAGMVGNMIFSGLIAQPGVYVWLSGIVAFVAAAVLTRLLASGLGRVLPSTETYDVTNRQLVGRQAQVRYAVSDDGGTAQVYDQYGRLLEVAVRVQPGEALIPAQTPVVIWRYDEPRNVFLVTPEHDETGS